MMFDLFDLIASLLIMTFRQIHTPNVISRLSSILQQNYFLFFLLLFNVFVVNDVDFLHLLFVLFILFLFPNTVLLRPDVSKPMNMDMKNNISPQVNINVSNSTTDQGSKLSTSMLWLITTDKMVMV
ncbi:unnamed protein product [Rotaria socialis]|uniref:Uncharacterized protein n=2 Tax=Rotaria socialis TaxID=392032 RepID=A0A817RYX2_9BILA|nr:unnamed protein product [Rotaria socialis]